MENTPKRFVLGDYVPDLNWITLRFRHTAGHLFGTNVQIMRHIDSCHITWKLTGGDNVGGRDSLPLSHMYLPGQR